MDTASRSQSPEARLKHPARPRVAVTGAAGFIGSNLCSHLADHGYNVLGIDNLSAGTLENVPTSIEFLKKDICEADLDRCFAECETVFHLAAKNCLLDCAQRPVETARNNVVGTANVLDAIVKARVPHLIYADTSAEYEGILDFPSRTDRVRPLSVYACSKRGGALLCESMASLHGFCVSFVRYFNVYGPAQDWRRVVPPVMSAFTQKLLQGERPLIYGTGEKRRDFIHVDDVNAFHRLLLENPSSRGKTYNLGSGTDHSVLEIFDKIESRIGSGLIPEFREELPGEAFRTLADISETTKTGWRPVVSLEAGLERFIEYTRARLLRTS